MGGEKKNWHFGSNYSSRQIRIVCPSLGLLHPADLEVRYKETVQREDSGKFFVRIPNFFPKVP